MSDGFGSHAWYAEVAKNLKQVETQKAEAIKRMPLDDVASDGKVIPGAAGVATQPRPKGIIDDAKAIAASMRHLAATRASDATAAAAAAKARAEAEAKAPPKTFKPLWWSPREANVLN
jgi:hypothetical protein